MRPVLSGSVPGHGLREMRVRRRSSEVRVRVQSWGKVCRGVGGYRLLRLCPKKWDFRSVNGLSKVV